MDPTLKKHPKATTTTSHLPITKNPDPKLPSKPFHNMSKHLSKLYPHHKVCTNTPKPTNNQPPPPPPSIHAHLQAKAMTVSADFDASARLSLIRPTRQYCRSTVEPKVVKEISRTADESKEASKEKVKKLSSMDLVGKKKVQQLLGNEKRHHKKKEVNDKKEVKDLMFEGHDEDIVKRMSVLPLSIGDGRRRSLCGSQVELGDFLAGNGAKIVSVDMPPFMQIHAVDCARKTCDSLEKFTSKTLALSLKKEFDGVYGPAWHCIVGTSFGSFVTHSVGGFLYFSMDQKLYILLFKTTVQRAD